MGKYQRAMWTDAVDAIYEEYLAKVGVSAMESSIAHIVWSDYNLEDEHIRWCLDEADGLPNRHPDDRVHELVKESLEKLLLIPEDRRYREGIFSND